MTTARISQCYIEVLNKALPAVIVSQCYIEVLNKLASTGILSKTLDNVTITSTGTVKIVGILSKTLDDVTIVSTGTIAISNILSVILDDVTITATGTVVITGTLSKTLDDVTITATGTIAIAGILDTEPGFDNEPLDNVIVISTGTVVITGTLSKTLDNVFSETEGESVSLFPDISPNYVCTDIAMFSTLKVQFREDIKIEQRLSLNNNVRWSFKVHWSVLSNKDKEILQQFFIARRGSYASFTWYHFQPSQVIGTNNANYTCIKTHTSDSTNKPITGENYGNYWEQSGFNGITWENNHFYKYEFRVRFKMDIGNFGAFSQNLWNFNEIELIECN